MASRMTFLAKFRSIVQNIETLIHRINGSQPGIFAAPALCYDNMPHTPRPANKSPHSELAAILEPVMYAVQRNRRTVEKRKTRKMTDFFFQKAIPKQNIVNCLTCGHPHEKETICGKCYEKVRAETEEMRKAMGDDTFYYDHPRKEVRYLYQNDDREDIFKLDEKDRPFLVEVPKNRPEWFPRDLVKKKITQD